MDLKAKDRHLRKTYGITIEQYNEKLAAQDFKCAVCEKPASECKRSLHVDHDHKKEKGQEFGMVRGLICFHCNKEKVRKHTLKSALQVVRYLSKYYNAETTVSEGTQDPSRKA